jgi:hypothetical protein
MSSGVGKCIVRLLRNSSMSRVNEGAKHVDGQGFEHLSLDLRRTIHLILRVFVTNCGAVFFGARPRIMGEPRASFIHVTPLQRSSNLRQ